MARAHYISITCKSAVYRVKGMPFRWSLNPYRGCVHACQYCYARETHSYLGLNAGKDFETSIFYKSNIAAALERELHAPSWPRESIAIGTATDAYQPGEGWLKITRACIEVLARARNPISIVTKSTLIKRDLDLLSQLARCVDVRVYFSITTLDDLQWRQLEPGTPPPAKRLQVLSSLSEVGITTGVLMAPVIPGLTDTSTAIDSVARAAAEHGATTFSAQPLRLAPLVKNHFMNFLAADYPELFPWYATNFRADQAPNDWRDTISGLSREACDHFGLNSRTQTPPSPDLAPALAPRIESTQLQLF